MKKLLILLAILALPLVGRSQAGYIGDLIAMQYGLWGMERVKDVTKHTNATGYFAIMPEITSVIDTIWWTSGFKPSGVTSYMHTDTLFAGILYPFHFNSIKLTHGRCLLYKNHP